MIIFTAKSCFRDVIRLDRLHKFNHWTAFLKGIIVFFMAEPSKYTYKHYASHFTQASIVTYKQTQMWVLSFNIS